LRPPGPAAALGRFPFNFFSFLEPFLLNLPAASNLLLNSLPKGFFPDQKARKDPQNEEGRQNTIYIFRVFGYKRIRKVSSFKFRVWVTLPGGWVLVLGFLGGLQTRMSHG
jgi:hypothetical protein